MNHKDFLKKSLLHLFHHSHLYETYISIYIMTKKDKLFSFIPIYFAFTFFFLPFFVHYYFEYYIEWDLICNFCYYQSQYYISISRNKCLRNDGHIYTLVYFVCNGYLLQYFSARLFVFKKGSCRFFCKILNELQHFIFMELHNFFLQI